MAHRIRGTGDSTATVCVCGWWAPPHLPSFSPTAVPVAASEASLSQTSPASDVLTVVVTQGQQARWWPSQERCRRGVGQQPWSRWTSVSQKKKSIGAPPACSRVTCRPGKESPIPVSHQSDIKPACASSVST